MTGTYPDVPGRRIAYDRLGASGAFYREDGGGWISSEVLGANLALLNGEAGSVDLGGSNRPGRGGPVLIFPEPIDIAGWAVWQTASSARDHNVQWSPNTTNGIDGVWIDSPSAYATLNSKEAMRMSFTKQELLGVKGIRWIVTWTGPFGASGSSSLRAVHLYGEVPHQALEPRLHGEPTGPAHLDWGDLSPASSEDRVFAIHNRHWRDAHNLAISVEAITDTTPSVSGQHLLAWKPEDEGGVADFQATIQHPRLRSGETTPPIILRRVTPAAAQPGPWWARVKATASHWSGGAG